MCDWLNDEFGVSLCSDIIIYCHVWWSEVVKAVIGDAPFDNGTVVWLIIWVGSLMEPHLSLVSSVVRCVGTLVVQLVTKVDEVVIGDTLYFGVHCGIYQWDGDNIVLLQIVAVVWYGWTAAAPSISILVGLF